MSVLSTVRLVIFATLCIFSLITLGILANFTNITSQAGFYFHSFALGIAVSLMTMMLVLAVIIVDKVRKGALTSLIWFELAWVGLLWVLWLATAASITSLGVFASCGYVNSEVESNCRQYQAVQAFSWLNWLMLIGWFATLLILSIICHSRGETQVWFAETTRHSFFGGASGEKPATSPHFHTGYPDTSLPQQNNQYQPQGYPQQGNNYPQQGGYPQQSYNSHGGHPQQVAPPPQQYPQQQYVQGSPSPYQPQYPQV